MTSLAKMKNKLKEVIRQPKLLIDMGNVLYIYLRHVGLDKFHARITLDENVMS